MNIQVFLTLPLIVSYVLISKVSFSEMHITNIGNVCNKKVLYEPGVVLLNICKSNLRDDDDDDNGDCDDCDDNGKDDDDDDDQEDVIRCHMSGLYIGCYSSLFLHS